MAKVTSLETQKKNPKRVNLFVDGKFVVGLDLETALKERLEEGTEISESEIKHLIELSGRQKVLEKVFKFLSFRPRSEKEVRDYLWRKKIDEKEAESIIEELKKKKYLSDEEFAKWWIEQRMILRPTGWRLLKAELRQKGVKDDVIEEVKGQELEISETKAALKLAEKKLKVLKSLPELEFRQKLSVHLARRGFDWETIKEVVDEICQKR